MIATSQPLSPQRVAAPGRRGGFTLIEIVVTLFIVTLVIGAATLTLSTSGPKKDLLRPAVKMKVFARKALALARNTQRPHSIFMNQDYFVLRETHMRQEDIDQALAPQQGAGGRRANFKVDDGEEEESGPAVRMVERYDLDEGTELEVRRFNEKDWSLAKNVDWNFYTSGICDPIMIRFNTEQGFIEMEFNPLTAKVQLEGERFEIYDQD
jgi:prepilin-type N-terminal cleavage/methylation domain-containing protein